MKIFFSFLFCIFVLNVVTFIGDEKRIILLDVINGIFSGNESKLGFNNVGAHVLSTVSFILCYLFYRKEKFWEYR